MVQNIREQVFHWYVIDDTDTYYDGYSYDGFLSGIQKEVQVKEFGLINQKREKVVRLTEDFLVLPPGLEFGLSVPGEELVFEMKRHMVFQAGAGDADPTELPREYRIGWTGFKVTVQEETGEIGFMVQEPENDGESD